MASDKNVLTEEFLCELYNSAFDDDYMCSVIYKYMEDTYLPDKQYQVLNNSLKSFFREHKAAPKYGVIRQMMACSRSVLELLDEIKETAKGASPEALRSQFESFLKQQSFKKIYREIGKKFENGEPMAAIQEFQEQAIKMSQFTLEQDKFIDVADTFESRLKDNYERKHELDGKKNVCRFYIPEIDNISHNRSLRSQLTVWLAMSGVGKSHVARWIGKCAAYEDGLDVLHFQLEGSESECLDAYSAAIVKSQTYEYENGTVTSHMMEKFRKDLENYSGTLKVKSYPKFGKEVSTTDLRNACEEYKKKYGKYPDIVIVDSLDLLTDSRSNSYDVKSTRFKVINVAKDLKDLAADINAWVVATYQATIEDAKWVNDEKNVLDGYNTAEAKGLQRPCTHLISLNRSAREEAEQTMRIHIAKSRFFKKATFRIATDYDHEQFYDAGRTLNMSMN